MALLRIVLPVAKGVFGWVVVVSAVLVPGEHEGAVGREDTDIRIRHRALEFRTRHVGAMAVESG